MILYQYVQGIFFIFLDFMLDWVCSPFVFARDKNSSASSNINETSSIRQKKL